MRNTMLAAISACLAQLSVTAQTAAAGELRVVREIDFPERLERAVALAWDGERLNASALVPAGQGSFGAGFLRIDPGNGSVASEFGFGGLPLRGGMTFDGRDFWASFAMGWVDWLGVRIYSHTIERWSGSDGVQVESVGFPHSQMEPTGLEWDGTDLWLLDERRLTANDGRAIISRLDSDDLTVVASFPVAGTEVRGLTWDGSAFWTIDIEEDVIYRFDSEGNVLGTFSSPDNDAYGITYDGEHLWVAGNGERKLYQLAVPEPSACALLTIAAASVLIAFAAGSRFASAVGAAWPAVLVKET